MGHGSQSERGRIRPTASCAVATHSELDKLSGGKTPKEIDVISVIKRALGIKSTADVAEAAESAMISSEQVNQKLHTTPRLHEKFPQVRSLAINLMISPPDYETEPTLNGRSFGEDSLAYFEFRCKKVECRGGGFDLTETISDGISAGEKSINGRRICNGHHGQGTASHNHIRCGYELNFRININYTQN